MSGCWLLAEQCIHTIQASWLSTQNYLPLDQYFQQLKIKQNNMTSRQWRGQNVEGISHDLNWGTILALILKSPGKLQKPVTTVGLWVQNFGSVEHEDVKLKIYWHHKDTGCAGCWKSGWYAVANHHGSWQKYASVMAGSWILLLTRNFVHYGYGRKWLVARDAIQGKAACSHLVRGSLGKNYVKLFSDQYE